MALVVGHQAVQIFLPNSLDRTLTSGAAKSRQESTLSWIEFFETTKLSDSNINITFDPNKQ
ncbi:MAG: hypothetical protein ACJA2S_002056 [Cyclobacteriaceae bacterium]